MDKSEKVKGASMQRFTRSRRAVAIRRFGGSRSGRMALAALAFAIPLAACTSASGHSVPAASASSQLKGSSNGAPAGLDQFYTQSVSLNDCGNGFQCGTIQVPLDYANPSTKSISIAIVRKPATDPAHRIGSLLVNPGGPGGSGIDYARSPGVVSAAVGARFDIIGFDPRGVGQSTSVHCLSDPEMDTFLNVPPDPNTTAEQNQVVDQSKFFAGQCAAKSSSSILPFVGTVNAARDMDIIRAVLGDKELYYLGKSYGTYLGAVYAEEFPKNVGRLVLDGAIDPSLTADQLNLAQAKAFDAALHQFAQDCVTHDGCPLGSDPTAGVTHLKAWVDGLATAPISGDSTRKLTSAQAMTGIAVAMYDQTWWPDLRGALTKAYGGDGSALLAMADVYNNRVGGHYQGNEAEANFAVNCVDHPHEADSPQSVEQSLPAYEQAAPFFGEMVAWSGLPCAYWPAQPDTTPHKIAAPGAQPILVVGTTRDPATPYAWAQSLAGQLKNGRLLTMNGDGHTAYLRGSTCIDGAVDNYLLQDTLPPTGTVCSQGS
jgi:pimeloyl-ACP methyl ester carboxylesterase